MQTIVSYDAPHHDVCYGGLLNASSQDFLEDLARIGTTPTVAYAARVTRMHD